MSEKKQKKQQHDVVPKAEYDALNDKYLRALADYQNLTKRMQVDREQTLRDAQAQSAASLMSIKDDVDKAEIFLKDPGLALIKKKISDALLSMGIEEFDPLNAEFDPEVMECIHVESGERNNIVTAVHAKGYKNGTAVLKPAKVTVSKVNRDNTITN